MTMWFIILWSEVSHYLKLHNMLTCFVCIEKVWGSGLTYMERIAVRIFYVIVTYVIIIAVDTFDNYVHICVCLSVCLPVYLTDWVIVCLSVFFCVYHVCLSIWLTDCLFVCLSLCLSCLSFSLCVYLCLYLCMSVSTREWLITISNIMLINLKWIVIYWVVLWDKDKYIIECKFP